VVEAGDLISYRAEFEDLFHPSPLSPVTTFCISSIQKSVSTRAAIISTTPSASSREINARDGLQR
jgi:hypothetical protein